MIRNGFYECKFSNLDGAEICTQLSIDSNLEKTMTLLVMYLLHGLLTPHSHCPGLLATRSNPSYQIGSAFIHTTVNKLAGNHTR